MQTLTTQPGNLVEIGTRLNFRCLGSYLVKLHNNQITNEGNKKGNPIASNMKITQWMERKLVKTSQWEKRTLSWYKFSLKISSSDQENKISVNPKWVFIFPFSFVSSMTLPLFSAKTKMLLRNQAFHKPFSEKGTTATDNQLIISPYLHIISSSEGNEENKSKSHDREWNKRE